MFAISFDGIVMEKIVNSIIENQLKHKESIFPHTYVKSIFKFKSDKFFKGHTGNVTYGQYEDETCFINISNKYYDVTLNAEYYFSFNKTILSAIVSFPVPKYFKEFMEDITNNGQLILDVEDSDIMQNHTVNYDYNGSSFFSIQYTYKYDGFIAFNHYENIRIVQHIKNSVSTFKSIVRENKDNPLFFNNIRYIKGNKVYLSKSLFI